MEYQKDWSIIWFQAIQEDYSGTVWLPTEYEDFKDSTRIVILLKTTFLLIYTLEMCMLEKQCMYGEQSWKLILRTNLWINHYWRKDSNQGYFPDCYYRTVCQWIRVKHNMPGFSFAGIFGKAFGWVTVNISKTLFMLDFSLDYSDNGQIEVYVLAGELWLKDGMFHLLLSLLLINILSPGTYIFHVKYCDGAGIWNDTRNNFEDCHRTAVLENKLGYAWIFHLDM